jgi:hypothetical protein
LSRPNRPSRFAPFAERVAYGLRLRDVLRRVDQNARGSDSRRLRSDLHEEGSQHVGCSLHITGNEKADRRRGATAERPHASVADLLRPPATGAATVRDVPLVPPTPRDSRTPAPDRGISHRPAGSSTGTWRAETLAAHVPASERSDRSVRARAASTVRLSICPEAGRASRSLGR